LNLVENSAEIPFSQQTFFVSDRKPNKQRENPIRTNNLRSPQQILNTKSTKKACVYVLHIYEIQQSKTMFGE